MASDETFIIYYIKWENILGKKQLYVCMDSL